MLAYTERARYNSCGDRQKMNEFLITLATVGIMLAYAVPGYILIKVKAVKEKVRARGLVVNLAVTAVIKKVEKIIKRNL